LRESTNSRQTHRWRVGAGLLAPLTAICAAAALASCDGSGTPQLNACSSRQAAEGAIGPASPPQPFVGLVAAQQGAPAVLARLDPSSLRPVSGQVRVAEYHNAWSLSPDETEVALGVSAGESVLARSQAPARRIGMYIVDLRTMQVVKEVQTGVAAEAVGWLRPRRVVAALQRGGTVLVDPLTGRVIRRWPSFSFPDESALTPSGLVLLLPRLRESAPNLPLTRVTGPPRVAVVDYRGRLRSASLGQLRLVVHTRGGIIYEDRAGLAVDAAHGRAYVVAPGARIAVVDLRTMRASYVNVAEAEPPKPGAAGQRGVLWLGDDRIAVYGRDIGGASGTTPAGVMVVNTRDWRACVLDRQASAAIVADNRILAYGPGSPVSADEPGTGLRAYALDGADAYHDLGDREIRDVEVAGGRAYVRTPDALYAVDVVSGAIQATIRPARDLVDVIGRRRARTTR
jgi:hypothetical protein